MLWQPHRLRALETSWVGLVLTRYVIFFIAAAVQEVSTALNAPFSTRLKETKIPDGWQPYQVNLALE
jgi:hypothetical protein